MCFPPQWGFFLPGEARYWIKGRYFLGELFVCSFFFSWGGVGGQCFLIKKHTEKGALKFFSWLGTAKSKFTSLEEGYQQDFEVLCKFMPLGH